MGAHGHSACITDSCDYLKDHSGGCGGQSFSLQQQKCFSCEHSSLCYRVNLVLFKHSGHIFNEYMTIVGTLKKSWTKFSLGVCY